MAQARDAAAWRHTGEIMALLANLQRADDKARIWSPADFNPHLPRPRLRRTSNPDEV